MVTSQPRNDPEHRVLAVVETIAESCSSNTCPAIYRTDRGSLIVRGYSVSAAAVGVPLSEGEDLVEIPLRLLLSAIDEIAE
jgi:hypothetical protein